MSKRVLIAGYYGFGNAGDEAILAAFLRQLRAVEPDVEATVVSGDPRGTERSHDVRAVDWTDVEGLLDASSRNDLIVLGGGGLFHDHWAADPESRLTRRHGGLSFYGGIATLALLADKPLFVLAVGVGPLSTAAGRAQTAEALSAASAVSVRDVESQQLVVSLGFDAKNVRVVADPAFDIRPSSPRSVAALLDAAGVPQGAKPLLGVSVRPWGIGSESSKWEGEVAAAVSSFVDAHGGSVIFVPMQDARGVLVDDAAASERVRRLTNCARRCVVLPEALSFEEKAGVLGACDVVLGMRLHALIFAMVSGVPPVALAYDPKVSQIMVAASLATSVVALESVEAGAVAALLHDALSTPEGRRRELSEWTARQAARSREGAAIAHALLRDGASARPESGYVAEHLRVLARQKVRAAVEAQADAERVRHDAEAFRTRALENERTAADARADADRARGDAQSLRALVRESARATADAQAEAESVRRYAEAQAVELATIKQTAGWTLLQRLWAARRRLAPQGSRRGRFVHVTMRAARVGWHEGLAGLWRSASKRAAKGPRHEATHAPLGRVALSPPLAVDAVVRRVEGSKGAVLFLPSIGWNVTLFQRPHHFARALAQMGYVVVFDSSNANDGVHGFQEIEHNLFLFNGPVEDIHRVPRPLLWAFPYNYDLARRFPRGATVLYDWIDDLEVFADRDRASLEATHRRALGDADIVVSVARTLHDRALKVRSDALYVPNGVEVERFASGRDMRVPDDIAAFIAEGKPLAGYYGAIAEWFDYELFQSVADQRPDWNFLLIGPDYDGSLGKTSLTAQPNVRWLGPRPYASLPAYLRCFDVALIPFRINQVTLSTSPLKLYEYFAGGKPVIASPMPECAAHPEVEIAGTVDEFVSALATARGKGRDASFRERLRSVARANSWSERARQIESVLSARG